MNKPLADILINKKPQNNAPLFLRLPEPKQIEIDRDIFTRSDILSLDYEITQNMEELYNKVSICANNTPGAVLFKFDGKTHLMTFTSFSVRRVVGNGIVGFIFNCSMHDDVYSCSLVKPGIATK